MAALMSRSAGSNGRDGEVGDDVDEDEDEDVGGDASGRGWSWVTSTGLLATMLSLLKQQCQRA